MAHEQVTLGGRYAPRDKQVLTKQVADELVIVDMTRGIYHGLNRVGVQVWEQLDGQRSLSQIADNLAERYPDVDYDTIEADTLALVQALLDNGLVIAR